MDEEVRIDGFRRGSHFFHRLEIVETHEVETEAAALVLFGPIGRRIEHELPHHKVFGSRLVAATRSIR